ncbi:DUF815 domain-containing protein (plasmid) [Acinetobacter baumannii]|nr:DUF815 domain-containing protein [Acinetobacter baumannii]
MICPIFLKSRSSSRSVRKKFIVYCDDLAFNAEDENYRSLKKCT